MTRAQARDLINTVDSRHQGIQKVLRRFVNGEKVSDAELDQLESPYAPVVAILKAIRDNQVTPETFAAIENLDTRNAVLRSLLHSLAEGFEAES